MFILKIMSLQPFVSGGKSPLAVFVLLVLALFELRGVSWAVSGALGALHMAVLYADV